MTIKSLEGVVAWLCGHDSKAYITCLGAKICNCIWMQRFDFLLGGCCMERYMKFELATIHFLSYLLVFGGLDLFCSPGLSFNFISRDLSLFAEPVCYTILFT